MSLQIVQAGEFRVDGSAALVAAEQLTMTMNQGLFDIQVSLGTEIPNGIIHSGSTTGPAIGGTNHQDAFDRRTQDTAITMLIGADARLGRDGR